MSSVFTISRLGDEQRDAVRAHLIGLSEKDRYSRFMYAGDGKSLEDFIARIDFASSIILGAFIKSGSGDSFRLLGLAQLDFVEESKIAEVALSVDFLFRRSGCGSALLNKAITLTKEKGYPKLSMICLTTNDAMVHLSRKMGFKLVETSYSTYEWYLEPSVC